jgi:hypothetical protein
LIKALGGGWSATEMPAPGQLISKTQPGTQSAPNMKN